MKRILILLFLIGGVIQAQTFGDSTFYGNVTSVNNTSTFQLRQSGQTKTITWSRLNSLLGSGSSLLSQSNNWTASQTYKSGLIIDGANSGYLQLSTTKVGSYARQPYFDSSDSTLYITDASGNAIAFKGQSYGDDKYATASGATDLPATYMTLATGQTVTGNKTVSSTYDFTNGSIKIPYESAHLTANSTNSGKLYYLETGLVSAILDDDQGAQYRYDFVSKAYADANYTTISDYVPSTGTKTDNTSTLTWTSGTVKHYISDPNYFKLREGTPTMNDEMTWQEGAAVSTEGIYIDVGSENMQMPSVDATKELIKTYGIDYTAPSTITPTQDTTITASFSDNSTTQWYMYNCQDPQTVTFTNMAHGKIATFEINDCISTVTLSASGWTIEYPEQSTPDFSDGKQYHVQAKCMGNSKIWVWVTTGN